MNLSNLRSKPSISRLIMKNNILCTATIQRIRTNFIHFPHVQRILTSLDRIYNYHCINEEADHIMLVGESGVGKSTLLTMYASKHPRIEHEEFTEVPVLYAALGPTPTPKTLAHTLLKALGDQKWHMGREVELSARLVFLIKQCHVRLVIIDEANHLIDRGGRKRCTPLPIGSRDWLMRHGCRSCCPEYPELRACLTRTINCVIGSERSLKSNACL